MTQSSSTSMVPGFTRLTTMGTIGGVPTPKRPSGVVLQDSDGYDYYLWVDTSGKLRTADAAWMEYNNRLNPALLNSGGIVVGSQP